MTQLGKLIQKYRLKSGFTQKQVGTLLGYSNGQFISNIERGICGTPIPMLLELKRMLNMPVREVKRSYLKDEREKFESEFES